MSNTKLKAFSIKGYKSIKEIEQFEPRPLNILIGPNGAGKSNFISFFKFLSWVLNSNGQLQEHVAYLGGANDILHDGVDATQRIDAAIAIETNKGINEYQFSLMFAKPDKLVFREEKYRYTSKNINTPTVWRSCGVGHLEAQLPEVNNATATVILNLLRKLIVYQFHNTSDTAPMRVKWSSADGRKGTNKIFNAGQASDGMLRTIALVSLLAQNPKDLPT